MQTPKVTLACPLILYLNTPLFMSVFTVFRRSLLQRPVATQNWHAFHSSAHALAPKVIATRVLPQQSQARLLSENLNLTQWQQDCLMPRAELLEKVKGETATWDFKVEITK